MASLGPWRGIGLSYSARDRWIALTPRSAPRKAFSFFSFFVRAAARGTKVVEGRACRESRGSAVYRTSWIIRKSACHSFVLEVNHCKRYNLEGQDGSRPI